MKIREITRRIVKRMPICEHSRNRLRLAVAFIAGIVITAALAHTPIAADMLSPQPIEEPVVPISPGAPGSLQPGADLDNGQPVIIELVRAAFEEAALPC